MKTITLIKLVFSFVLVLIIPHLLHSQTYIPGGDVYGTWSQSGNPYIVTGIIEVPGDSVLILNEGVDISFYGGTYIIIIGKLIAEGSSSSTIKFHGYNGSLWNSIRFIDSPDTSVLSYCEIYEGHNYKGGGVYILNTHVKILNCLIYDNWAEFEGGGVWQQGGSLYLYESVISNNHTVTNAVLELTRGGGIFCNNCIIENCEITGNILELQLCSGTGYCRAKGGGIYAENAQIIENNISSNKVEIQNNSDCIAEGGGIYVENAQIIGNNISYNEVICIDQFAVSSSVESLGGGISGRNSVYMRNNLISNNLCFASALCPGTGEFAWIDAISSGGGIHMVLGVTNSVDNRIINNSCISEAETYSSGWGSSAFAHTEGGGIHGCDYVTNCLIMSNSGQGLVIAPPGNALINTLGGGVNECNYVQNSTIMFNSVNSQNAHGGGVFGSDGKNCIIFENTPDNVYSGNFTYSWYQDPLFVSGPQGSYYLSQTVAGQSNQSPCVDTGDPTSQLFPGTTRTDEFPDTSIVDMGFHYPIDVPGLYVMFSSNKDCGLQPLEVQFQNCSYIIQVDSLSFEWDFENDGIIDSYEESPLWTYYEFGNYSVKLKVIGLSNGEIVTDSIIKVNCILVPSEITIDAYISVDNGYGECPLTVSFTDNSVCLPCGEIDSWQWDFENDGVVDSYAQNPGWIYEEPGIYSVQLVASINNLGFNDTILKEDLISTYVFQAGFYAEPLNGYYPMEVYFFDTSQVIIIETGSWQWDFENDGVIDSWVQNPSWMYELPGIYSVRLVITDSSGFISSTAQYQNYISIYGIIANFDESLEYGEVPLNVMFTNTSWGNNININYWQWDFENDGIVDSYAQNPDWIYEEPGIYSVKLITSDSILGVSDTILKEDLIIGCSIEPDFHAEPLSGYNPLEVSFLDSSQILSTEIGSWNWDFEDDGTFDSWEQNPVWLYEDPGVYSVELIIFDSSGQIWHSCVKEDYIEILTTGSEEDLMQNNSDPLIIYPNPFTNILLIEYHSEIPDQVSVKIYDSNFDKLKGILENKAVKQGNNRLTNYRNNQLESGLYYIVLTTGSGLQYIRKIIKVN